MKIKNEKKILFLVVIISLALIDFLSGLFIIPKEYNAFRCAHFVYHHDLLPNQSDISRFAGRQYPVFTNSLGFRDGKTREVSLNPIKRRVVVIGDSFAEAVGVTYEKSFAGLIGTRMDAEILNAGVVGYSPKLYYLKVKYLIEKVGLRFNELMVFIDISDILNEIEYEDYTPERSDPSNTVFFKANRFLRSYSATYYLASNLLMGREGRERLKRLSGPVPCWGGRHPEIYNDSLEGAWTIDKAVFNRFGRKGLGLAEENMQALVELCKKNNIRPYVVVYPWPEQIYYYDRDSIQVSFWRKFCERNGIDFISLFPAFIDKERYSEFSDVMKLFLSDKLHWNEAGHELVAVKILDVLDNRPRVK